MFGMSNSVNMDIYSDLYNRLPEYNSKCVFHPESLIGFHLNVETKLNVVDINNSPFCFEYPVDWNIPIGYNRETYRQAF